MRCFEDLPIFRPNYAKLLATLNWNREGTYAYGDLLGPQKWARKCTYLDMSIGWSCMCGVGYCWHGSCGCWVYRKSNVGSNWFDTCGQFARCGKYSSYIMSVALFSILLATCLYHPCAPNSLSVQSVSWDCNFMSSTLHPVWRCICYFCVQVAIFLIQRNRQALLGRSIDDVEMRRIINLLIADPVCMFFLLPCCSTFSKTLYVEVHGISSICHGPLNRSIIHFCAGSSPCVVGLINDCCNLWSLIHGAFHCSYLSSCFMHITSFVLDLELSPFT